MVPSVMEFPRFNRESRVIMGRCGRIDPEQIQEYIADGGYGTLAKALALDPEQILETIEASGLRGRGGAGFPMACKWRTARQTHAAEK